MSQEKFVSDKYKYSELTGKIIGCAMEVHRFLGNGFQEVIYQRALAVEMTLQNIPYKREYPVTVLYKGVNVGSRRVDFLIDKIISLEIKATTKMDNNHLAQAINYLEAFNLEVGLLINFGASKLEFHRLNNKKYSPSE